MPPVPVASYFVEFVAESFPAVVVTTLVPIPMMRSLVPFPMMKTIVPFPMMKTIVTDSEPEAEPVAESESLEVLDSGRSLSPV